MEQSKSGLTEFVLRQMRERDMSARQFSDFIGVSNTTINRTLDNRYDHTPSMDFLLKLADKTGTSIVAIIELAFPEVSERTGISPEALILAQRLDRLPESIRDFILKAVLSAE